MLTNYLINLNLSPLHPRNWEGDNISAIADLVECGRNVERNQESKRNLEVENTVRQVENSVRSPILSIGLRKATMRNDNVFFAHCQISAIAFSSHRIKIMALLNQDMNDDFAHIQKSV
jgi:hypothetical protein